MLYAFGLSPFDPLSFVRFSSGSGYSAFCFFLSVFFPFSPQQWLLRCTNSAFALSVFPVIPNPVSRVFFPGSRTRLSVSFLSSFPVSLPQLFHRCLPYALCFRYFPLRLLSFVRFRLGSDYSAFRTFFSLSSRFSLTAVLPVHIFLFRWACCHAFLPILVLSLLQFFSPNAVLPHSGLLQHLVSVTVDFPWLTL